MASNKSIPPPLTLLPTSPPRPVTPTAVESKRKPQLIKEGMDSIDIDGNDMPKQPTLRPFTAAESKCSPTDVSNKKKKMPRKGTSRPATAQATPTKWTWAQVLSPRTPPQIPFPYCTPPPTPISWPRATTHQSGISSMTRQQALSSVMPFIGPAYTPECGEAFYAYLRSLNIKSVRDYLSVPQHPTTTPLSALLTPQYRPSGTSSRNPKHIPYDTPEIHNPEPMRYPKYPHGFGRDPKEFDRRNFRKVLPDRALNELDLRTGLQFYSMNAVNKVWSFTKFSCGYQRLSNINLLSSYPALQLVILCHNRLSSARALSDAEALRVIDLEGNRIGSPLEIPHWPKIIAINLRKNNFTTLHGIKRSFTLEYLNMSNNLLRTTDGITPANFPVLRQLEIRGNQIESLGKFELKNLEQVFMAENLLSSLNALKNCRKLRTIHARSNRITSLKDFPTNLPELEYVNLRSNWIERISQVEFLGKNPIKALILTDNFIARNEKYRVEVFGMVPTLVRLDKILICDIEKAKAGYLVEERAHFRLPPVNDEIQLRAPPNSPLMLNNYLPTVGKGKRRTSLILDYPNLPINETDGLDVTVQYESDDEASHEIPMLSSTTAMNNAFVTNPSNDTTVVRHGNAYYGIPTSDFPLISVEGQSNTLSEYFAKKMNMPEIPKLPSKKLRKPKTPRKSTPPKPEPEPFCYDEPTPPEAIIYQRPVTVLNCSAVPMPESKMATQESPRTPPRVIKKKSTKKRLTLSDIVKLNTNDVPPKNITI